MNIRPATQSDMKRVEEIFSLPELATPTGDYLSAELLSDYLDEKFFLVAEDSDKVIGALFGERLKNKGIMLWLFAVDSNLQGKGIGNSLLNEFENNMRSEDIEWIMGYAPDKNVQTLKFYKDRGFNIGKTYVEFLKFLQ